MKVLIENQDAPEPEWPRGYVMTSYVEATATAAAAGSETTYDVDIKRDWVIGLGE